MPNTAQELSDRGPGTHGPPGVGSLGSANQTSAFEKNHGMLELGGASKKETETQTKQ